MYFVTTKRPEYVLFCMSPSERFALGLDEQQVVHLFARGAGGGWDELHKWSAAKYSHTAFMASLRDQDEPADRAGLLKLLPAEAR